MPITLRSLIGPALEWRYRLRAALRAKGRSFPPEQPRFHGVVSRNPLILYHLGCDPRSFQSLHEALGDRDAWIIRGADWVEETAKKPAAWVAHTRAMRRRWPRHRYIFACNTLSATDLFRAAGLRAEFLHHNALLDERLFTVEDNAEKTFDAVYTARLQRFKRIELAAQVPRLAILTYDVEPASELLASLRESISAEAWINFRSGSYERLDAAEMARIYSASRVGLMLSAEEGGNYATAEYFLCGLPLVTTRSTGGRSEFDDDRFVCVVEPDAGAVARATRELVDVAPDPHMIRKATIERMEAFRDRFRGLLDEICAEAASETTGREIWDQNFYSKFCTWQSVLSLMDQIEGVPR